MSHKTYIPKKFFYPCKIVKKAKKWVDSVLQEVDIDIEFQGALFNLGRHDVKFLTEQGINITLDSKKIYCYIDIDLKNKIEFNGELYLVTTSREYLKHDELRIYYIERIK